MKIETVNEIKETFKMSVRTQVAKGGGVRWGEAESLAVVEDLVTVLLSNEDAQAEGFDAIRHQVGQVINPSAFAQRLEKLEVGHPSRIVRPKRGTGGSRGLADL